MKVAIITDSNSGITQAEAKELGIFVLPMPFMIDGIEYMEDVTLSQEEFYQKLTDDADITTSQPAPGNVMDLWDSVLEEYDEIVHIPMSSSLSSSYQTALMLADDYDGKVQVVDNKKISVTQMQSALDAKALAAHGHTAAEIKEKLEAYTSESTIYIMVDTLKYLKKGGRITPAAAALGTLLRLKPVLTVQEGKLDAHAKARTVKQAKSIMITAVVEDIKNRWNDEDGTGSEIYIAHSNNYEEAVKLREELAPVFPKSDIRIEALSLSVSCHVGPGGLAIAAARKMEI